MFVVALAAVLLTIGMTTPVHADAVADCVR
jgi:hypothetical protein